MSDMNIDFRSLKNSSTEEVLDALIEHITKSDDEMKKEIENGDRSTELKVYVAENRGLELGEIEEVVEELFESEDLKYHGEKFFQEHKIQEHVINEELSFVEITTPGYNRTDQFIFYFQNDFIRILTTERKSWSEKTVEKLVKYIPSIDRFYLSYSNLKDLVESLDKTSISGFTAKYRPYYEDKKMSIRFHGGDKEDLKKVEREFNAKPTRIEFSQRNSPSAAILGSFDKQGIVSFPKVREGSEEKGKDTLKTLTENYAEKDRANFDITNSPKRKVLEAVEGITSEGFTSIELRSNGDMERSDDRVLSEHLEEDVLDKKRRYRYGRWDENTFFVFDKNTMEQFEIGIENENIVIHSKENTSAKTVRELSSLVIDHFNSTYDVYKVTEPLRVKS